MKAILLSFFVSTSAFASASACVVYVSGEAAPVTAQVSCDGADIKDLFQASGISAAISKAIPYFMNQGYSFQGCSDSYVPGVNNASGYAFSRCFFIKGN